MLKSLFAKARTKRANEHRAFLNQVPNYEITPVVVKAEFRGDRHSNVTHKYRVWVTLSNGTVHELCTINKMRTHLFYNPTNEVDLVGRTMDRVKEILHLN
jgi:hypothetical protein